MTTLSPRVVSALVAHFCAGKLTPVARAARRHERAFMRVFFAAVHDAQDAIKITELEHALHMPGTGAALWVLNDVIDAFLEPTERITEHETYMRVLETQQRKSLRTVYVETMTSGARAVPLRVDSVEITMSFDATNPEAIAWAERRAALLVTEVTKEVKQTIRVLVVDGFESGVPPRETAQLIRASIGLTERHAQAVMKRQIEWMQSGISATEAAKKAERYAEKLTRSRALTIARTETMAASNAGQRELWRQAKDEGLLSGREKKVWLVADPCPICADLDGETVRMDQEFSIGSDPPAHPNCRCTIGLVS